MAIFDQADFQNIKKILHDVIRFKNIGKKFLISIIKELIIM